MSPLDPQIPLSIAQRIDAACDSFEETWIAGQHPDLDQFVRAANPDDRAALLRELIPLDVAYRRREGQIPLVSDYETRFPELPKDWLKTILEQSKSSSAHAPTVGLHQTAGLHQTESPDEGLGTIRYFGDYELLEEIARGGMGVVYKARQLSLDRIVAVKQILSGNLATRDQIDRFVNEAKTAALLDHPNIVPLYEVGQHGEQHYLSMAYIDGQSLDRLYIDDLPEPREAARIMATVAEAMQYAHGLGIVHRDLKPSNILLGRDRTPRITDFGLAKRLDDSPGLTTTGEVLGTPSYMPPEQASGKINAVGPSSDVYSIGAVLYMLLSGRPPFKASSAVQTLKQVLEREPASPRSLNSSVPRDLETIAMKCLEKSIPRRYESARAVADELHRFLEGRPILARPIGRWERSFRWCRRNPVTTSLIALLAIAMLAGTITSSWFAWRASQRAIAESKARLQEKEARKEAERQRDIAQGLNDLLNRDILGQTDIWIQAESQASVDPNITVKATLERAAAHVKERFKDRPDVEAAVRRSLGTAFSALGEHQKAIHQLEQSVELWKSLKPPNSYEYLGTLYQLGKSYWMAGRQNEAVTTLRACVQQAKKKVGLDSRELIEAQMSLATVLLGQGGESLKLLEELRPAVERTLPADDIDALHFQNILGHAQQQSNQMPQALETFTNAHSIAKARFGDKNPLTMMLLNNRARWYLVNNRPAEAMVYFEQLEPVISAELGADNQFTLLTRGNLGFCCLKTGDPSRAATLLEDVVTQLRKTPGARHPFTRLAMNGLAQAFRQLERLDEAAELYEELLTLSAAAPGPAEVMPPNLVWPVAQIYAETGKQKQLANLIHIYQNFLSSSPEIKDLALADELDRSARYLLIADEAPAAEQILRRSLNLRRQRDADGWKTFFTESQLGGALLAQQKLEEAEKSLISSYQGLVRIRDNVPLSAKAQTIEALERLVKLYQESNREQQAHQWQKSLEQAQQSESIVVPDLPGSPPQ